MESNDDLKLPLDFPAPRFSVLVPSRNRSGLLVHAINSVLRQGRWDVEIVISDNCSEENYQTLIESYADPRLRLSRADEPLSVTDNWNRALQQARGQYVVMLGDDDTLCPNYFVVADGIIDQFGHPDVIYSPAYHYAWPGVMPNQPSGYLASVLNSQLFDAPGPYLLTPERAVDMARLAMNFRHYISFNAQHFLYSRQFIDRLLSYGPVYQSPYPDYYACFATFMIAERIVVDPEPRTIIGISKQSFGYFLVNDRETEGAEKFLAPPIDIDFLAAGDPSIERALILPGSQHIKHWLCASLTVCRRLGFPAKERVNLSRYKRIQAFELAFVAGHARQMSPPEFWRLSKSIDLPERSRANRLYWLFRTLGRVDDVSPASAAMGMRKLLSLHGPAQITFLEIGAHVSIIDAFDWLEAKSVALQMPPEFTAASELSVPHVLTPIPASSDTAMSSNGTTIETRRMRRMEWAHQVAADVRRKLRRFRKSISKRRFDVFPERARTSNLIDTGGWGGELVQRIVAELRRAFRRYRRSIRKRLGYRVSNKVVHATAVDTRLDNAARFKIATLLHSIGAQTLRHLSAQGSVVVGRFAPALPLNLFIDESRGSIGELLILLPSVRKEHATGGPNSAYLLGCAIARRGIRVCFLATDVSTDSDPEPMRAHLRSLCGIDVETLPIRLADASDRGRPYGIGAHDVLLATAWWTAQMAQAAIPLLNVRRIYYLIQDFEPLFYPASENWAQAIETYSFPHVPIVNTSLLRDDLFVHRVGAFSDPGFSEAALTFEPAVDRKLFHPVSRAPGRKRRLLFYARPTVAVRNLFGMGVAALTAAVEAGLFEGEDWEILGMGEPFAPVPLGKGFVLQAAPWLGIEGYAAQIQSADILLSLMLSPHPSYPPLEMAACGGVTVTTTYGVKSASRLAAISSSIIAVEPSIGGLLWGLQRAFQLSNSKEKSELAAELSLPSTWDESFAPILSRLLKTLSDDGLKPVTQHDLPPAGKSGLDIHAPQSGYYRDRRADAQMLFRPTGSTRLLSLVTTVYDTESSFLVDLAHSIFAQREPPDFEWILLDNGSTSTSTRDTLRCIARDSRVKFIRIETNLGIIGGMRRCLELARNRYIVPIDSDDLLAPHALRSLGATLEQNGMPPLVYSDEDKTDGTQRRDLYRKPDWDPVLFQHSCFIAHLTALDRELALQLDCYGDPETEGSHDWDSFTRFAVAGHRPVHLPDAIYTWRMHSGSTSADFRVKPVVFESQRAVLRRFLRSNGLDGKFCVVPSPIFNGTPDWRFASKSSLPLNVIEQIEACGELNVKSLLAKVEAFGPHVEYVHLVDPALKIVRSEWAEEALTLFELFPDTAMIGGRSHRSGRIVEAAYVFGAGAFVGAPERNQDIRWPGDGAQSWKPRSVGAVSARHSVVRRSFLVETLRAMPETIDISRLGIWLGAVGARANRRIVCTPILEAEVSTQLSLPPGEDPMLAARYGDIVRRGTGAPPRFPCTEGQGERLAQLASYSIWFGDRLANRARSWLRGPALSIITTVYENTNAELFSATAKSVADQILAPREWLVLAHGSISPELGVILRKLSAEGQLRALYLPENLGISGGLRYCLERVVGEYIIPVDGDDLLTDDALALIAEALVRNPDGRIVYTDEDLLIEEEPRHPWHRPDHDPVLLQAHSAVWHSIAFHRETGLSLGVYGDRGAEYALDWDTLLRFHRAGHQALHVAEVTYHWRQHANSISHSGGTFDGSTASVRHVLEGIASSSGFPRRFSVSSAPFASEASQLVLRRLSVDPPSIARIDLGSRTNSELCLEASGEFEFAEHVILALDRGARGLERLEHALQNITADFVFLVGPGVALADWDGLWQAIGILELNREVGGVGGPLVDAGATVRYGPMVELPDGTLVDALRGRRYGDPGRFSLAHRPHCVSAIGADLFLARTNVLIDLLSNRPAFSAMRGFGAVLGVAARQLNLRLAWEPRLRGALLDEDQLLSDPVEGVSDHWRALAGDRSTTPLLEGFASLVWHDWHHL